MNESQHPLELDYQERKVTRSLDVKLSQSECAEMGLEIGRLADEIETHKAAVKEASSRQEDLIDTLRRNKSTQDVECVQKMFYSNRLVQVWSGDFMVEERAMTDTEFQLELGTPSCGVVEDDPIENMTQEEAKQDLEQVMREERSQNKASLVDL